MFIFNIGNDTLKIHTKDPFGDGNELILYLSKQVEDDWVHLAYPSLYSSDLDTKEKTDAKVREVLVEINLKLTELYGGGDGDIPENGFERVKYIIENLFRFENDKVVY